MNKDSEWPTIVGKLTSLWRNFNPNTAVADGWYRIIGGFRYEVVDKAIEAYWAENADKFEPSHKEIKKLCLELVPTVKTSEQLAFEAKWHKMGCLEQNRYLAFQARTMMTRAESDDERAKWEHKALTAECYVRRLEFAETNRPPPDHNWSDLEHRLAKQCDARRAYRPQPIIPGNREKQI